MSLSNVALFCCLEQFPKSVKRFSDKNCGKNKELEQLGEPSETKTALDDFARLYEDCERHHLIEPVGKRRRCGKICLEQFPKTACLMILMDLVLESNQDGGESFHLHLDARHRSRV